MLELNNSIFYKVKFDITANQNEVDLIWKVIYHIKSWLTRKWNKGKTILTTQNATWSYLKRGGTISSTDKKSVYIESEAFEESENMQYWACRIFERKAPRTDFAPREWITEIGVKPVSKGKIEFSCVISYIDRPGFIGKCEDEPYPNVPNLIKNLLQDKGCVCEIGCDLITTEPQALKAGEWIGFWERVTKIDRQIPYIFIATKSSVDEENYKYPVDPKQLAIAAGGNARVFYAEDQGVMDEMDYFCPNEYKCYNGSIRIYFPKIDTTDPLDIYRHRYLTSNTILQLGQEEIVQMIRRALAQDIHFYETFFRLKDCRAKQENFQRQLRLEALKTKHQEETLRISQQKDQEAQDWCNMALLEEEKRLHVEDDLEQIKAELQALKEEKFILNAKIDTYRGLAEKNASLERACNNRLNTKTYPSSPMDVINYFDASFADCIAFSEDVYKSLKNCTISLADLWSALYCLATTMRELYLSAGGDIYKEFTKRTGIDVGRGEGANTHQNKKMMDQYSTEYHGYQIDIEPHIKFSRNHQRIHFGFCQEDQKVIVGWCGEHKDNATTHKVK
ncbi:MAG: hypothetical protein IJZ08_06230 [Clostridia bacterium]|nr:hypothetical protein [Clostridia bacterium]